MRQNEKKRRGISLRWRMHIMVAAEMVVIVGIAYLLRILFPDSIFGLWSDHSLLAMIALSLLLSSALTWALSWMFFNPIRKLKVAMAQVAKGDFSVHLDGRANAPEVQDIYAGFNLMTQELSNTEILQTDFVSSASHEFKTPLNAIEGYSTLLQNSDNLDPQQREYVEKIIFNTRRLSTLTGSILLLSKIENQAIPALGVPFRLDEQIRQSILALEGLWAQRDTQFDVDLEEITYRGNEGLMHHVWDNLISNAIKFGPEGGCVRIRLWKAGDRLCCTVADSGPGIAPDALGHIFDKFYQADSSHRAQGNGLGLALVQRIVALEGGTVQAENLPQGGCCFTVRLKNQ